MKATFTREHWAAKWDEMMKWVPGDQYMNLEAELAREMKYIDEGLKAADAHITEEQYKALQRIKAQLIIEKATAKCKEQMAIVKKVKAGKASLGGVTELQVIHFRHQYFERFEFNCYQLAVFREKYGI